MFVNLDVGATPLAERLGDLPERLERYRIPSLVAFASVAGQQPVNWKIVIDNYLEGHHVPIAHPRLMRLLDYRRYAAEVSDNHVWFEAPLRDKPAGTRQERLYRRLVRPMPGLSRRRRPRVAVRVHLSEHRRRPLPGPGDDVADQAGRRVANA